MKDIKKQFRISWKDMLWVYGTIVILAILGTVIGLAFRGSSEDIYIPKGMIIAGIVGMIVMIILEIAQYMAHFHLAVAMGMPRKKFFWTKLISTFALQLSAMVVWMLMGVLELGVIWMVLGDSASAEVLMEVLPSLLGGGFLLIVITVLGGSLCAAFWIRFGKIGGAILWCLWMLICIGGPNLWDAYEEAPDSVLGQIGTAIVRFFHTTPKGILVFMLGLMMILVVWGNYRCIRKQEVRV